MKDLAKNPFLIVGVSADAEMSEIRQVAQRRMMGHRLDDGENSPAARRIETALEQLQDPVQRFVWGLYWPELTAEEAERFRADPVLSTLGDDPLQDGASAYARIAADVPADIRNHNVGILSLLQAVAATEEAQKGTPDDISDDLACCQIWVRAFQHLVPTKGLGEMSFRELQREAAKHPALKRGGIGVTEASLRQAIQEARGAAAEHSVASPDAFWMRKNLWAKDLGDKRLNAARLKDIRASYMADLLAPTGAVITTALLDGHAKVAKAYVEVIQSSGFEGEVVEATLSRVYKPLADRVERAVEVIKSRLPSTNDSRGLRGLLNEFKAKALADVEVMLQVGDLPGYAEEHARDTSAQLLRSISIKAWNDADDGDLAGAAIAVAERIADSDSLRSKLGKDRSQIAKLHAENKESEKLQPLFDRFQRALESKNHSEARSVLDQLIAKTTGQDQAKLKHLRTEMAVSTSGSSEAEVPWGCIFWVVVMIVIAASNSR